jgi:ATP-dependent DNA helicase RecG
VQWSVPLVAVREAVVSAIVYADYAQQVAPMGLAVFEDRVEIETPGLLTLCLTNEDIQHHEYRLVK